MLGLAAPTPLARKAVDVLAQTPADILTVLLLLAYIGTVAESSTTSILSSTDLLMVGQRWRLLKVPMGWDFNQVHVWAASTLVKEELGWEVGLGFGYPFQPSPQTQTHVQTSHKLLGLPTACIWHLAALAREYNHDHSPTKQNPTHLYDDRMMGIGQKDESWVPLDTQIFESACRMETIAQRVYGLAEVGRVVESIEVEVGVAERVDGKSIGSGFEAEGGKGSPFIFRDPDLKTNVPSVSVQEGGKRKRQSRATSDGTSMRIIRSRSDVGAVEGTPQVDVQEYAYSAEGDGRAGQQIQVDDDCEMFIQAAVEVSEHELGTGSDL